MSDADRVDARLTGIDNTVEQMDTRLGELNGRMNERLVRLAGALQDDRRIERPMPGLERVDQLAVVFPDLIRAQVDDRADALDHLRLRQVSSSGRRVAAQLQCSVLNRIFAGISGANN